ncbi:MAG: hypothetical protein LBE80_01895 [Deltaproteobacteria bacterium]|nr:hypothetical protein [Deltaproteobacteria bacterium]
MPQEAFQGSFEGQYLGGPVGLGPGKKKRAKAWIIRLILLLILVGLGGLVYGYLSIPWQAKESFIFAMDMIFGQENYEYGELNYDRGKKSVVANNVTFKLAGFANELGLSKIDRIEMVKPASKSDFEKAFSGQAKPESILSEKIIVEGPKIYAITYFIKSFIVRDAQCDTKIGLVELVNLKYTNEQNFLSSILPNQGQNLNFESIKVADFNLEVFGSRKVQSSINWSDITISFGDYKRPLNNDINIYYKIISLPIKYVSFSNFKLEGTVLGENDNLLVKFDYLEAKNYFIDKLESFDLKNPYVRVVTDDIFRDAKLNVSLNNFSAKDIDFSSLRMNNLEDLENFFTSNLAYTPLKGSFEFDGLRLEIENYLEIALKRLATSFDWAPQNGLSTIVSSFQELDFIALTNSPYPLFNSFYDYWISRLRYMELSDSFEFKITYDPKTTDLTLTGSPFSKLNVFVNLDGSLTLTGIRPTTLNELKKDDPDRVIRNHPEIQISNIEINLEAYKFLDLFSVIINFPLFKIVRPSGGPSDDEISRLFFAVIDEFTQHLTKNFHSNYQIATLLHKVLVNGGKVSIKAKPALPVPLGELNRQPQVFFQKLGLNFTFNQDPPIYPR